MVTPLSAHISNTARALPWTLGWWSNLQIKSEQLPHPLHINGLWDCGSTGTLLPATLFNRDEIKLLNQPKGPVTGISGSTVPVGLFVCDIEIGDGVFEGVEVSVVDTNAPPLLGMNLMAHPSVQKLEIYRSQPKLVFNRVKQNSESYTHTVPTSFRNPSESYVISPKVFKVATKEEIDTIQSELSIDVQDMKGSNDENSKVSKLLFENRNVFATDESPLGKFPTEAEIPTTGEAKWVKQYSIPQKYEEKLDLHIQALVESGAIEPCPNPKGFNTPVLIRPKKNGDTRFIMDFKNSLNKVLSSSADPWQMPSADPIIARIGRDMKFFSTLDLKAGYWQIPIKQSDRYKTAFQPRDKCWQWTRVPFGLTCAGQIFSRCIAEALETVLNRNNFAVYIDDLLVYSKDFETHIATLDQIFAALQKYNLHLNSAKCTFLQTEANFLGRIVTRKGFRADPAHVQGITEMPAPTSLKELQMTIGRIVWMRHFVETRVGERARLTNFSTLISHMNLLNRKENRKSFTWTPEADAAFERVKKRLSTAPIIHFADFSQPFVLVTDASEVGIGAVLLQKSGDKDCIVAVASQTLSPVEQRWSATEREAYAVVWGVEKFDYFLRARPFTVLTDHKSLTYIDRTTFKNPKIARWQERLEKYHFVVEYIEGDNNVFADMLSRPCGVRKAELSNADSKEAGDFYTFGDSGLKIYIPSWCRIPDRDKLYLSRIPPGRSFLAHAFSGQAKLSYDANLGISLANLQRQDPFLRKVIQILENPGPDRSERLVNLLNDEKDHRGVFSSKFVNSLNLDPVSNALLVRIGSKFKFVAPESQIGSLLYQAHDNCNHFGRERVLQFLSNVWWPRMKDDVTNYLNSCETCLRRKGINNRGGQKLTGTNVKGQNPFEILYIDFVHMPTPSRFGHKYILTVIDSFSRFFIAIPCHRDRALDAAEALVRLYCRFGTRPKEVSSDRGTHFTGSVMTELHKLLGIKMSFHVAWHPESSGIIERQHRTLKNSLFITANERNCDWIDILDFCVYAMNAAYNRATKCSPFAVIFGRNPDLGLPTLTENDLSSSNPVGYGMNVRVTLEKVHKFVRLAAFEADKNAVEKASKGKPPVKIVPGDIVYVKRPQSAVAKDSKLDWIGPLTVLKTNDHVIKIRTVSGDEDWISRAHTIKLEPRKPHLIDPDPAEPIPFPFPAPVPPIPPDETSANLTPEESQPTAVKSGGLIGKILRRSLIPKRQITKRAPPPPAAKSQPPPTSKTVPVGPQKSKTGPIRPTGPPKFKPGHPRPAKPKTVSTRTTSGRTSRPPDRLQVGKVTKTAQGKSKRP